MNILFLAPSLLAGGAERQMTALACGMARHGHAVGVAVFSSGGDFETDLHCAKVPLFDLRKRGRFDNPAVLLRLAGLLKRLRPDILHSCLGTANIMACLLKPFFPRIRTVLGVRASAVDLGHYGRLTQLSYFIEERMARLANLVIANSHSGRAQALARGFPEPKLAVVHNGIDCQRFRFDPAGRARLRAEWGASAESLLVGIAGRLDPMKDHPTFLKAAALLVREEPRARFVCIGGGPPTLFRELEALADHLGLGNRMIWAGPLAGMVGAYSALDILCSASAFGEGFPNVVGEAMACGVPCVVTDVGDSALVVGDAGLVVPRSDPRALAAGLKAMADGFGADREGLARSARQRIETNFGLERMISRTEQLLAGLLSR